MLCALAVAAPPIVGHAQKDLASCRPVLDAIAKQMKTPSHAYTAGGFAGASSNAEIIFVGGVTYVNARGQWRRSPTTAQAREEQLQEKHQERQVVHMQARAGRAHRRDAGDALRQRE